VPERRMRARVVIEGDTAQVKKALKELEQQSGETGVKLRQNFSRGYRGAQAEADAFASRMKSLLSPRDLLTGVGLGAGLAGIGAAFRAVTQPAADFEEKMAEVSTILDTSKVNMDELRQAVLDTSKEFGKPAVEQAGGLYQILSAGITDAAEAIEVLRVATKAGIAGVTDTETAVDGITSVINAFGLKASDAGRVADAMFKTVERGKVVFRDLSQFMGQAAPTFAAVDMPFEEMLAAVSTLTASGIRPNQAFEGLRSMLSNVIRPSEQARKTAHALGVEFDVTALRSKGLAKFLREINQAAKGNTEVISNLFGDITGLQVALALGGQQSNRFESDLRALEESAGATDTAFQKQKETFNHLRREIGSLAEEIKIGIGNQQLPILGGFLEKLKAELDAMPTDLVNAADQEALRRSGRVIAAFVMDGFLGIFEELSPQVTSALARALVGVDEEDLRRSGRLIGAFATDGFLGAFRVLSPQIKEFFSKTVPGAMSVGATEGFPGMEAAGGVAAGHVMDGWHAVMLAKLRQEALSAPDNWLLFLQTEQLKGAGGQASQDLMDGWAEAELQRIKQQASSLPDNWLMFLRPEALSDAGGTAGHQVMNGVQRATNTGLAEGAKRFQQWVESDVPGAMSVADTEGLTAAGGRMGDAIASGARAKIQAFLDWVRSAFASLPDNASVGDAEGFPNTSSDPMDTGEFHGPPVPPEDPRDTGEFHGPPVPPEPPGGGGGGAPPGPEPFGVYPFAHGGRTLADTLALVGERGPELIPLPRGAQVLPNDLYQMAFKQGLRQGGPPGGRALASVLSITREKEPEISVLPKGGQVLPNDPFQMAFKHVPRTAGASISLGPIYVSGVGSPSEGRAIGNEIGAGIVERLERMVNL